MASMTGERVKGSTKGAAPGWAYIKDRCDGCNRVVYAYVPLDTPLDPPMCGRCRELQASLMREV